MGAPTSLLDWILGILRDPDAQAAFQSDPEHYAARHGFQDLSAADVHDALCLIADNGSASYDHRFSSRSPAHYPPPHHYDQHQSASHYLNHYVNTYTTMDDSAHQNIDTHGSDFHQDFHQVLTQHADRDPVVASGHGAVASGGDLDHSTLTSGDHNVAGDDNRALTGDHDTTAFGVGDATNADLHDVHTGVSGGLSVGGDAYGHDTTDRTSTSVHSSSSGDTSVTAAGAHGDDGQYADQSSHDGAAYSVYDDDSHTSDHHA